MRLLNLVRLAVNGIGLLLFLIFLVQVLTDTYLRTISANEAMVAILSLSAITALWFFDFDKRNARSFVHLVSCLLWLVLWAVSGLTSDLVAHLVGWADRNWYGGIVAPTLMQLSMMLALALCFTHYQPLRQESKKSAD